MPEPLGSSLHEGVAGALIQAVGFARREYDLWLERTGLLGRHLGICHDDDLVAHLEQTGCRTIQADTARMGRTCNHIGLDARTIVVVHHVYVLACHQTAGLHQRLVDGDTAHVVQIGLSDAGTMYF